MIASLGDSAASGEGAPEHPGGSPPFVASEACDRSGLAASAQAAERIQQALINPGVSSVQVTVHFWHLACSGSQIAADDGSPAAGGILTPFDGAHHDVQPPYLPPQVPRVALLEKQSALTVDRLLMTTGINELYWSVIAKHCGWEPLLNGLGIPGEAFQNECIAELQSVILRGFANLPNHFDMLGKALTSARVNPARIFLTEYFDPIDSQSLQAPICAGDPVATATLRVNGLARIIDPLEAILANQATANSWNFLGGIQAAFQGHGVCWIDPNARWINTFSFPDRIESDQSDTWHANPTGQTALAGILYTAITPGLFPAAPAPVGVPNVKGLTAGNAIWILTAKGFAVSVVEQVDNLCESIGIVRGQLPGSGTAAAAGSTVKIFVGKRPSHPCP